MISCSVTSPSSDSAPSPRTIVSASWISGRPGSGRPRIAARPWAERAASIMCAVERSLSRPRSAAATRASHGISGACGVSKRCSYQPGLVTPAP